MGVYEGLKAFQNGVASMLRLESVGAGQRGKCLVEEKPIPRSYFFWVSGGIISLQSSQPGGVSPTPKLLPQGLIISSPLVVWGKVGQEQGWCK